MLLDLLCRPLDFVSDVIAELVRPLDDPCPHDADGTGECEEPECQ
ncbi:hypothetical protein [Actinacidiphila glaucinigra]|uniref:Uncharacterized protein n=1 Tax=Actinacidiphila glaucinigra TaxID=235986 RepID=A0A239LJH9_9ACTN|nr:hypothetical protein [Actinacidiphila glaucinigra]SNT30058.1 hypothetical protein SAMN05216252_12018 [Actinacidiphila glaucinigra]